MSDDFKLKIKEVEQKINELDIDKKKNRLEELEKEIQDKDFWDRKDAPKISQEMGLLKEEIEGIEKIMQEIEDLANLYSLMSEQELNEYMERLGIEVDSKLKQKFLSGLYDHESAIISIQAGAGGRDAEDWAALLLKMYQRWAERNTYKSKIISQRFGEAGGPEGRIGIKEACLKIRGRFIYGLLKKENGVHRLVRISPFSSKELRHTSFAMVEVLPEVSRETGVELKPENLKIETFRASGPGGQYVNKRETAVRIIHVPTGLRAESQVERLQGANKKTAMKVLSSKLVALKEQEKEKEIKDIKGDKIAVDFGSQIRSYVFHPYKLVKDHRTNIESANIDDVMDGDIDKFIEAEIKI